RPDDGDDGKRADVRDLAHPRGLPEHARRDDRGRRRAQGAEGRRLSPPGARGAPGRARHGPGGAAGGPGDGVRRERVRRGADAEEPEARNRDPDPQQVEVRDPVHAREERVDADEALEREHQYTPSSPNRFASLLAAITSSSPTRPLKRPTAAA